MSASIAIEGHAEEPTTSDYLPPLREELHLFSSASAKDGSPTWTLHDPVRNQFFRIDWQTFEILNRWSLGRSDSIAFSLSQQTALEVGKEDIESVRDFLAQNELIQTHSAASTESFLRRKQRMRSTVWQWLLHHYLFFRIPLWRPDRWLTRNIRKVDIFYARRFYQLTLMVLIVGVFECARQWTQLKSTLIDKFSLEGMIAYSCTLLFLKFLHELGHAFTAKRKGCRVPTMGIAFLVMCPVAYTDVNEVWKLKSINDRLAVGAAGIVTELIIAAWATCIWAFLPDGFLREGTFLLATTTWVSTVMVNASPFVRFDGYFLLSDFLDTPNLHGRAFALARWDLRERLFNLGEPVPESMSPHLRKGLIVFAWLVWLYRLALFLGIAALVYHFFVKAIGVILFAVEIGYFVAYPIWREISEWRKRWPFIRSSIRGRRSLLIFCVLLVIGLVPWNTHVQGQGMLRPARHLALYAPVPSQLKKLPHSVGTIIKEGDLILELESPDLDYHQHHTKAQGEQLAWQLDVSGFDDSLREKQAVIREQHASLSTQLTGYETQRERLYIRAPFTGELVDTPAGLYEGAWINQREKLGELIDRTHWQAEIYLEGREVHRVQIGDQANFYPETPGTTPIRLRVTRIDADATRLLTEPMLAIQHGGQIVTHERNSSLTPDKAVFRVVLSAEIKDQSISHSERGRVVVYGESKSLIGDYLKSGINVLIRESGW